MKAILVIDMPENCYDCQYCRFEARKYKLRGCILTDTDVQDGTIDIRKETHSCCPLKPMPKPMPKDNSNEVNLGFELGWNNCLEELEK